MNTDLIASVDVQNPLRFPGRSRGVEDEERMLGVDRFGRAGALRDGQSGQFVIALPKEQNLCFVYGFRAGQESVEKRFAAMANAASGSMTVKKVKDDKKK